MRNYLLAMLATVAMLANPALSHAAKNNHVLADNKLAKYVIVSPSKPSPANVTAVNELKSYLNKITGASFKVVTETAKVSSPRIFVGQSDYVKRKLGTLALNKLGSDGFIVRSYNKDIIIAGGERASLTRNYADIHGYNKDIIIAGGEPRGTLYGVYSFLEKELGVRWLTMYGDEVVPQKKKLVLTTINRSETPAFLVRDICVQGVPDPIRSTYKTFLARNRDQGPDYNFLGDNSMYGGTSHHYAYPPNNGWMVHTFFHWLPPEQYFETNPDFYSLIGGKRVKSQLCFSTPALRETLTNIIIDHIGKTDQSGNYALSAQDAPGALCECPDCKALVEKYKALGAPLFHYLTELGPKLKAKYPKAYITTLAYRKGQTETPPVGLKMPDNVIVIFAPIDDNFAHNLLHEDNAGTLENLRNWSKITDHLWIWYYPNPYETVLPEGNFARMADDFRVFKQIGVEGIFSEHDAGGVHESIGLVDMQTWIMAKLLWNPDQNLDALVRDFATKYYGKASPYILKHYNMLEQVRLTMKTKMSWNASLAQHRFLTPDLLISAQKVFDDAEKAAAYSPEILLRVRQARLSLDNASVLLFDGLSDSLDRNQLIQRYRSTYTATKRKNMDPSYSGDKLLEWHAALKPLKPLAEMPAGTDMSKVIQLTPENAVVVGKCYVQIDPEAAANVAAVTVEAGEDIFGTGFYDCLSGAQTNLELAKDQIKPGGEYHLYKIGRSKLNEQCYLWTGVSWLVQVRELPRYYDPLNPDKQYDIYVSLKFEGAAYGTTDPEKQANRVYMDRIVLVPVD